MASGQGAGPVSHEPPIVVGVDGSDQSLLALKWAADEARRRGAILRIIYAGTGHPKTVPDWFQPEGDLSAGEAVVDDAVALVATSHPGVIVTGTTMELPADEALTAASRSAGLLVVGARGRGGFAGLRLGSVGETCMQQASCPVAIVRTAPIDAGRSPQAGRIVVGVDGSAGSDRALRWALDEGERRSLPVLAIHAWHEPYNSGLSVSLSNQYEVLAREVVEHAKVSAVHWNPRVQFLAELRYGPAVAELRDVCGTEDLLVVGSRGRKGIHGVLIGSVSRQAAHHVGCSIVVVPSLHDSSETRRGDVVQPGFVDTEPRIESEGPSGTPPVRSS